MSCECRHEPVYLDAEGRAELVKGERVLLGSVPFVVVSSPGSPEHPVLMPPPYRIFHPLVDIERLIAERMYVDRRGKGPGPVYAEVPAPGASGLEPPPVVDS